METTTADAFNTDLLYVGIHARRPQRGVLVVMVIQFGIDYRLIFNKFVDEPQGQYASEERRAGDYEREDVEDDFHIAPFPVLEIIGTHRGLPSLASCRL